MDDKLCFETNQVLLQPGNYFGVSASTGDMPDHHQLFGFKVTPLEAAGNSPLPDQHVIPEAKDRTPRSEIVSSKDTILTLEWPRIESPSRCSEEPTERVPRRY
jgi:hypothetical protein